MQLVGPLSRTLLANGPMDSAGLVGALAAHAVPGLDQWEPSAGRHSTVLLSPQGPVRVSLVAGADRVELTVATTDPSEADFLSEVVRNWLDLDTDLSPIVDILRQDPALRDAVSRRPGIRVLRHPYPYQAAVLTIIGQHVSLAAARIFAGRLVRAYGVPHEDLFTFPTAQTVAAVDPIELQARIGVTHARARTIQSLSQAVADGLDLRAGGDQPRARAQLLTLAGVGPWTVEYLAVRVLGDADAYPAGDRVLQRGLGVTTAAAAMDRAEAWRPWRAYGLFHVWTAAAFG